LDPWSKGEIMTSTVTLRPVSRIFLTGIGEIARSRGLLDYYRSVLEQHGIDSLRSRGRLRLAEAAPRDRAATTSGPPGLVGGKPSRRAEDRRIDFIENWLHVSSLGGAAVRFGRSRY
jgi:hypothetical protein